LGDKVKDPCLCGLFHNQPRSFVQLNVDLENSLFSSLEKFNLGKKCLLVCDFITFDIVANRVLSTLRQLGLDVTILKFERESELVANEYALGELMQALEKNQDFLIGVGSGTIADLVRYTAFITKRPFALIATAPSMDGYASTVAPLIQHETKKTFQASAPDFILGDLRILSEAPRHMIEAGVGDLLGKVIARADWRLSHLWRGEHHCPVIQGQVNQVLDFCLEKLQTISLTDFEFVHALMNGLILSGEAITMYGTSRPASGSEHQLAHFWEIQAIKEDASIGLHGQMVGYATGIMLLFYEEMGKKVMVEGSERLRVVFKEILLDLPSIDWYEKLLIRAEIKYVHEELSLTKKKIENALLTAMNIRDRYTILRLAHELGWLEDIVGKVISTI